MSELQINQFESIAFYIAIFVTIAGPYASKVIGQKGIVAYLKMIPWWITGFLSLGVIPYMIVSSYLIYKSTTPAWYSYNFGVLFMTIFLASIMAYCTFLPFFKRAQPPTYTNHKIKFNLDWRISDLGRMRIQKLAAFYLLAFSVFSIVGYWSFRFGWNNIFGNTIGLEVFDHSVFEIVTNAAFFGYPILWILVWMQRGKKNLAITLIVTNLLFGAWFALVYHSNSNIGWASLTWTNALALGLQGFFGLAYLFT